MEKRVIVAVALSILIIVAFQYFAPRPVPPSPPPAKVSEETIVRTPLPPKPLPEGKETEVETDKYILTFNNIGGAIKRIALKEHKNIGSSLPMELSQIKNPGEYIFNISSPRSSVSLDTSVYDIKKTDGIITYSLKAGDFEITKKYILHNSKHSIELQLLIANVSSSPKEFNYEIIGGAGIAEPHPQDKRLIETASKVNDKIMGFKRPKNGARTINPGVVSWTALKSKYFSLVLKPFTITKNEFYSQDADGNIVVGVESEPVTIQPGAVLESRFLLYAGPTEIQSLKEFGYNAEEVVNYGFFGGISKVLIVSMKFFNMIFHNWGISIIVLSIFLNIILFPLTMKSFKSMQKMQELHPQMEKLKIQHKGNPQKLNKEIMELYKKYKINPFSGCLPMVLQMPIFIALYQALQKSIELRGASFLWIKDLSSPDAVGLPVSFPIIGSSINILPLIMVAAMVIQQKISTKTMGSAITDEQKQQQKMMLILMPIMFGFIFYSMPSGLVLYWVVNTALTIVEQSAILKKD